MSFKYKINDSGGHLVTEYSVKTAADNSYYLTDFVSTIVHYKHAFAKQHGAGWQQLSSRREMSKWTLPMKYANDNHACVQTLLVGKRHRVVH